MTEELTAILGAQQIAHKVRRMAFEIREQNYLEERIIIIGIKGGGYALAELLKDELERMNAFKVHLFALTIDKKQPATPPVFTGEIDSLHSSSVILVDDVVNSGRTLMYATRFLLECHPRKLAIAALIDRFHRQFPIRADFIGLTLSTNLKEYVRVNLDEKPFSAWLGNAEK